ncbi:hypothetical protein EIP91_004922, partial [Steccherinum ochraceum]
RLDEIASRWNVVDVEVRCAWVEKNERYHRMAQKHARDVVREMKMKDVLTESETEECDAADEELTGLYEQITEGMVPGFRTKWSPQVLEALEDVWVAVTKPLNTPSKRRDVLFDPYSVRWQKLMDDYTDAVIATFPQIAADTRLCRTDAELKEVMDRLRFCLTRRDRPRLPIITAVVVDDMYQILRAYDSAMREVIRWIDPWIDYLAVPHKRTPQHFDRSFNLLDSLANSGQMDSDQEYGALKAILFAVLEDRVHRIVPLDLAIQRAEEQYPFVDQILNMQQKALMNLTDPSSKATPETKAFFMNMSPSQLEATIKKLQQFCITKILNRARTWDLKSAGWSHFPTGLSFFTEAEIDAYPMLYMLSNSLLYQTLLPLYSSGPRDAGCRMPVLVTLWSWYLNVTLPIAKVPEMKAFRDFVMLSISPFTRQKIATIPDIDDEYEEDELEFPYHRYMAWDTDIRGALLAEATAMDGFEIDVENLKAISQATAREKVVKSDILTMYKTVRRLDSARAEDRPEDAKRGKAPAVDSRVLDAVQALAVALKSNMNRQWMRTFPQNDHLPILDKYDDDDWEPPVFPGKVKTDALYFSDFDDAQQAIAKLSPAERKLAWNASWDNSIDLKAAYTVTVANKNAEEWRRPGVHDRVKKRVPRIADVLSSIKGKGKAVALPDVPMISDAKDKTPDVKMSEDARPGEQQEENEEEEEEAEGQNVSEEEHQHDPKVNKDDDDEDSRGDQEVGKTDEDEDAEGDEECGSQEQPQKGDDDDSMAKGTQRGDDEDGEDDVPLRKKKRAVRDDEEDNGHSEDQDPLPLPSALSRHRSQSRASGRPDMDAAGEQPMQHDVEPQPPSPTSLDRPVGHSFPAGPPQGQLDFAPPHEDANAMDQSEDFPPPKSSSPPPAPESQPPRRSERRNVQGKSADTSPPPPFPNPSRASSRSRPAPKVTKTYGKSAPRLPAVPEPPATTATKRKVTDTSAPSEPEESEPKRTKGIMDEHISSSSEDDLMVLLPGQALLDEHVASTSRNRPAIGTTVPVDYSRRSSSARIPAVSLPTTVEVTDATDQEYHASQHSGSRLA